MDMAQLIFVILVGLCFGSFATLASHRLPRGKGIVAGRSCCPFCHTTLRVRDLVPVLSWAFSRAMCHSCSKRIPVRYPLIELATAALFIIVYQLYGLSLSSLLLMVMSAVLLIMVVIDFEHLIIPDEIHVALLVLALGYHATAGTPPGNIAAGFAVMVLLGLLLHHGYYWIRGRDGLGYGDVKFFAVAGVWLGLAPLLPFLFISGLFGIATGLVWKWIGKGDKFPFAPSMALSLWMNILWPEITNMLLYN